MQAYPNEPNHETRQRAEAERASDAKKWHTVRTAEQLSDFSAGEDIAFETLIDDRVIAVFRHEGEWFAMDAMCAHQGGPLAEGILRDGCVTCPWHGWQYDLATGIQTINRQPLQESYQVRNLDDRIEVYV